MTEKTNIWPPHWSLRPSLPGRRPPWPTLVPFPSGALVVSLCSRVVFVVVVSVGLSEKGPSSLTGLLWTFGSLALALDVYSPALRGTSLNRLRVTNPGAFHRLVADAGIDRMVGLGSVVANQWLRELGTHSTSEESRENLGLKKLFSSFGEVVDVYVSNKVGKKSGRKYGFIRFGEFNHGKSAIEALNGESVNGHKLEVTWAKFQKRTPSRPSKQREEPQKKMQALLSYPNSNKLEAPNGNLEVAGNDVHEGLSDNSETITQPLNGAHNRSIFVGKFPSQAQVADL
ncbi:hypothetical protein Cgig2_026616 [Carnegiea gigantea]|uniref:RRM domain-containing protein n=1 Tax=Carnegiea gigantea TaxID=171969 RepID=A0A9Q1Q878_9CARY|nr:hypothetical protein Cgig2_026616 [Carnegiea gigantea]